MDPAMSRALQALSHFGLVFSVMSTEPFRLLGGRERLDYDDGVVAYREAFSFWQESDGTYRANVVAVGRGKPQGGSRSGPLLDFEDVVAFIVREYT